MCPAASSVPNTWAVAPDPSPLFLSSVRDRDHADPIPTPTGGVSGHRPGTGHPPGFAGARRASPRAVNQPKQWSAIRRFRNRVTSVCAQSTAGGPPRPRARWCQSPPGSKTDRPKNTCPGNPRPRRHFCVRGLDPLVSSTVALVLRVAAGPLEVLLESKSSNREAMASSPPPQTCSATARANWLSVTRAALMRQACRGLRCPAEHDIEAKRPPLGTERRPQGGDWLGPRRAKYRALYCQNPSALCPGLYADSLASPC